MSARAAMRIAMLVVIALPVTAAGAQQVRPTGPEMLPNTGFEEVGEAGEPAGWFGFCTPDWGDCAGRTRPATEQPHSGERAWEISGVRVRYAAACEERIAVEPGQAYVLSAWVRTELARGQSAYLVASWFSEERWLAIARSEALYGRAPWTRLELVLGATDRPEAAVEAQISVRVSGTSETGRAWVDDISLRRCEVVMSMDGLQQHSRRLVDMAREMLIERDRWEARLAALRERRADLERLLEAEGDFDGLVARWGEEAADGRFLTQPEPPRRQFEAAAPEDPERVREQASRIADLPGLRQECFAELGRTLRLKRQLDERPDARRLYLWAQLAAMRLPEAERAGPAPELTPEFAEALADPPEQPAGELLDVGLRSRYPAEGGAGEVALIGSIIDPDGASVQAALLAPVGEIAAFASAQPVDGEVALTLHVADPLLWFPDCRHTYELRAGVFRDGQATDWLAQRVAFRRIEIAETDLSATMRHAWGWAATDYSYCVNGQPYFLRGTRCSRVRDYTDEAAALFDELWLDYQRTYGAFVQRLSAQDANRLDEHGIGYIGSIAPDWDVIRSYRSSREGFDTYRQAVSHLRWLVDHPLWLGIEVGNEAELAAWGADLPAVYGDDLWHVFNEVTRVVETEIDPRVPLAYVRAARFHHVKPVPRSEYNGVNQYTGRYWGRRSTIASDLAELSFAAICDDAPIGITEWNGPKYSWATRGVSGVDEEGAASYIFDYYRQMTRTPATVLSTEFVLNWVATPLEDLTTVPLQQGLQHRAQWEWGMQKGTPWYPHIWPDLLTDTACRRTMRGFQSPLFDLVNTPGPIAVSAAPESSSDVEQFAALLRELGRDATVTEMPSANALTDDTNRLILGGFGHDQPQAIRALEQMRVIGRTTDTGPGPGGFFIQRRINPHRPDRMLVVVTAADGDGMNAAVAKLLASGEGLREAMDRDADRRRVLALVDNNAGTGRVFSRYVTDVPTRSVTASRDDVRARLDESEMLTADGAIAPPWRELAGLLVVTRRALEDSELAVLDALRESGTRIVWSSAALEANPPVAEALGVSFGAEHAMTEHLPVAEWAQEPLVVPDAGDVSAERVQRFARLEPDEGRYQAAMTIRELTLPDGWRVAAEADGRPVVAASETDWVFGIDLQTAAGVLWSTTQSGVNHSIYDRDTACGLERIVRLMINAATGGIADRPASTPRLRVSVATERLVLREDDTARVLVRVRGQDGLPADAHVRVTLAEGDRLLALPGEGFAWATAEALGNGLHAAEVALSGGGATADVHEIDHRAQRVVTVFAHATREGWIGDWNASVARIGLSSDEAGRMERLARLVANRRAQIPVGITDEDDWIEVEALIEAPVEIAPGEPTGFEVAVTRVEDERGDDEMEQVALVLRAEDGREVVLPVAPDRVFTGMDADAVREQPNRYVGIADGAPARFEVRWDAPRAGRWSMHLRYVYTDNYRITDTDHVQREDAIEGGTFVVGDR